MIPDKELQRLTDLEASATPGEWEYWHHGHTRKGCLCLSCDVNVGFTIRHQEICEDIKTDEETYNRCEDSLFTWADAHFIAESRTVFPELLREVKELRAWANRMPDAGLTVDDPRYKWWIERPCK